MRSQAPSGEEMPPSKRCRCAFNSSWHPSGPDGRVAVQLFLSQVQAASFLMVLYTREPQGEHLRKAPGADLDRSAA